MFALRHSPVIVVLCALVCAAAAPGCAEEFDTSRVLPTRGTLGEEIYRVLCERLAAEADPSDVSGAKNRALCAGQAAPESAPSERLRVLASRRDEVVRALDHAMPASLHDDLDHALVEMLPLYDAPRERIPNATRALAALLAELSHDEEALDVVARISAREGYRPLRTALGVIRPILEYDQFDTFAERSLRNLVENERTAAAWKDLRTAAALSLAHAAPDVEPSVVSAADESTFKVAQRLLLSRSDILSVPVENPVARRDARGVVRVLARGGVLPEPFVDMNFDGFADVDAAGRFVDALGNPVGAPSPFPTADDAYPTRDLLGRALGSDGLPLYDYLDANQTLLAGLARDVPTLTTPGSPALLNLTTGLPLLLGREAPATYAIGRSRIELTGFDMRASPAADFIHGLGVLLADPSTDDLLLVLDRLFEEREDVVAGLIASGLAADAFADQHDASLVHPSTLWDDVLRGAGWMAAEPGLTEGVLRALADPYSARMGPILGDFIRHRDRVEPLSFDPNRSLYDAKFIDPVDRNAPAVRGNQSLFQRVISVIHDFDQNHLCNKQSAQVGVTVPVAGFVTLPLHFDECSLVKVDNLARLFSQSIIGRARLEVQTGWISALDSVAGTLGVNSITVDQLFTRESGITGLDTSPTPEALARMAFLPQNKFLTNLFDPSRARDGVLVSPRHDATLFACEREYTFNDGRFPATASFYTSIAPLLRAFDDYDRGTVGDHIGPGPTSSRYIFGEFVSALHMHWPAPGDDTTQDVDPNQPSFAHHDNGVAYEENIAYAMDNAQMVLRLHELAKALDAMEVRPGVDGIDVLARGVEALLQPIAPEGFHKRDGSTTTRTNDGATEIQTTRMHLLLDALKGMDDAFATDTQTHARWLEGRSGLVDAWFRTDPTQTRFENRHAVETLRVLLRFVRERVAVHAAAGDRFAWGAGLSARFENMISDPVVTSLVRLVDAIQADPESVDALAGLLTHLGNVESDPAAFNATSASLVDLFQLLEDDASLVPLLHVAGRAVAPNAPEALASGEPLDLEHGSAGTVVELLADVQAYDDRNATLALLRNLIQNDPATGKSDLEVITDVLLEVNRATPGAGTPLTRDDHRMLLERSEAFLGDEAHGLERLMDVIQSRKRP